jgi:hypothetical protein
MVKAGDCAIVGKTIELLPNRPISERKEDLKGTSMFRFTAALAILAMGVSGCAPDPSKVAATYVSPATFASYNCNQIIAERNSVVKKVNELNVSQKKEADEDAALVGVGAILFWPALLFLGAGQDNSAQLAGIKGQYDALTAAGTSKGCF